MNEDLKFLHRMQRKLDFEVGELVAKSTRLGRPPPCRIGCTFCCMEVVYVTPLEVEGLVWGFRELNKPLQQLVRIQLDKWWKAHEDDDTLVPELGVQSIILGENSEKEVACYNTSRQKGTQCMFLIGGQCGIYKWRPAACRSYHSVEKEAINCNRDAGGGLLTLNA